MATKRQIKALEKKLNLNLNNSRVYVFDEVEGSLLDNNGQKISKDQLQKIKSNGNIILIDDI